MVVNGSASSEDSKKGPANRGCRRSDCTARHAGGLAQVALRRPCQGRSRGLAKSAFERKLNKYLAWLLICTSTATHGRIGARYGKEGPGPGRPVRGGPGPDAANDAGHESGKARRVPRSHVPAGSEI